MKEKMFEFLVSIVCYGNENEVCTFLNQLDNQNNAHSIAVAITINKAGNIQIIKEYIKNKRITCFVFEPNKNLGYLNGCLYGIKALSEEICYTWALICNTDITFPEQNFFETITRTEYEDMIWGIAPSIQLPNHTFQNPYIIARPTKKEMERKLYIFSKLCLFYAYNLASEIKKNIKRFMCRKHTLLYSKNVYAPHGSCMIFRAGMIEILLEEKIDIFLYCEEEYLAGLIYENSKKVYYDNRLQVLHNEHQTLSTVNCRKKQSWYVNSMVCVMNRFYTSKE